MNPALSGDKCSAAIQQFHGFEKQVQSTITPSKKLADAWTSVCKTEQNVIKATTGTFATSHTDAIHRFQVKSAELERLDNAVSEQVTHMLSVPSKRYKQTVVPFANDCISGYKKAIKAEKAAIAKCSKLKSTDPTDKQTKLTRGVELASFAAAENARLVIEDLTALYDRRLEYFQPPMIHIVKYMKWHNEETKKVLESEPAYVEMSDDTAAFKKKTEAMIKDLHSISIVGE